MKSKKILNIEGEILNNQELEWHLEKIATTHNLKPKSDKDTYPIDRMLENYENIKKIYNILSEHVKLKIPIHPAGEWLLDNFYIIEETVKCLQKELTLKRYTNYAGIRNGRFKGFARIYVLATEIVSYTDCKIDNSVLEKSLAAYQTKKNLSMDEIWDIGMFLQIAIIEKLAQIAEVIYVSEVEKYKVESMIERLVEFKPKDERVFKTRTFMPIKFYGDMKYPFVEYLSYKLKRYGKKTESYLNVLEEEAQKTGNTVSDIIKKEHFDIAVRKVSIGNGIMSLKKISRINFLEIFEKINGVEEILKQDPAGVYEKMDYKTKEHYRNIIKEISKKTKISEIYISKKLIELANEAKSGEKQKHIGFYLLGENVNILYKKLKYKEKELLSHKTKFEIYLLGIIISSLILVSIKIANVFNITKNLVISIVSGFLFVIPVSEFIIKIIEYVLSKVVKPKPIPKIDFYNGIDESDKTMVVIPTILNSTKKVQELIEKLEVYYLANKSENLYMCLLGDVTESKNKIENFDEKISKAGLELTKKLNEKYKVDGFPIFHFIYRKRFWNEKEGSYLGWERKRGALTEFTELLLGNFQKMGMENRFNCNTVIDENYKIPDIKYVITLDSDTDLTLNSAFELVGAMAHILNKPVIKHGKVIEGYALIQPRVGVNIDISYKNLFTKIFAGLGGIDSYTNAISDVYQDNFGEGIFTGKGIFDLKAYSRILKNEIPENKVLSHDLLEGSYLRCGLASDILIMDGYPTKYLSFMSRLSRWIRGDWQIIGWLKNKKLNALSKYKIFDNLRRSLIEVSAILGLIYLMIAKTITNSNLEIEMAFLYLVIVLPFLLELLNYIVFKREGEKKQNTFLPKVDGVKGSIYRLFLTLGCLPFKAYISLKSISKTLYRLCVSHKHLLEWTTSEEAEKNSKTDIFSYYKAMFVNIVLGIIWLIFGYKNSSVLSIIVGILWIATPYIMYAISKESRKKEPIDILNKEDKDFCLEVGERTFQFFKDNITKENNYLIPDNYQADRKAKYVDRTSSTNIGLSLLAVISGIDLNFIGREEGIELLRNMIETIENLPKWNGHLYNWYNIKTKEPLIPKYISTVDSGNFVGYLYVVRSFLEDIVGNIQDESDLYNEYYKEEINKDKLKVKLYELENLVKRITSLIENTNFAPLYSPEHRLFSIGFNIEENKLTDSYYDLLASEARQASFISIAKKDVPIKHWNNLSRTLTVLNKRKGLISWSGTAFEYLMPNINLKRYEGSLLDESCNFAIMSQIEYAKKSKIPWGISEAAFNVKDLHGNYQYKAFGIPWLGLKRGLADEMVIASYASILAILDKPKEVLENLKVLKSYGMYDKYGFYESLDLTPARQSRKNKSSVVATYMAHHQGLILLSINNLFNKNILQKRFSENPEIKQAEILLQERMPETFIITKEEKEKQEKLKYQDFENYAEAVYKNSDERIIRGNAISNEKYTTVINQKGQGFSKYRELYINRFKRTKDYNQGILFFIKNIKSKKIFDLTSKDAVVTFMPDQDKFEAVCENIKAKLKITLDPEEAVEIRRLEIENIGNEEESLEISCMFEPVLSKKEQDYAHPAFNNLFLVSNYDENENILEVKRKKRGKDELEVFLETKLVTDATVLVDNEFEIDKEKLCDRGDLGLPKAIQKSIPFSNKIGLVTEPIVAMKKTIKIMPGEKKNVDLIISVSEDRSFAIENLKKYINLENVKRAFELSRAKSEAESRYLHFKGKEINLYQKILSYIVFENPIKKKQLDNLPKVNYKQSNLWKYGISGNLPLILVGIKDAYDVYEIKEILKLYEFLLTRNILVDLVFVDEEKYSYENYVREEIENKILDSHLGYRKNIRGGIFILSKNEMSKEDLDLIKFVSSITIDAHKGNLEYIVKDLEDEYLSSLKDIPNEKEENVKEENVPEKIDIFQDENKKYFNEYGAFSSDGKEYLIKTNKNNRIPTVWSHILANEKFGTVVTESMGGYTWHKNCRLNRVSSWENMAHLDLPSEVIYIKDEETKKIWSLGQNPMPDENNYSIIYGFGYAKYIHESGGVLQEDIVFVPKEDSIKINLIKLVNNTLKKKKYKIYYYVKPVLGEDDIKTKDYINLKYDLNANMIISENLYESTFKSKAYISSSEKIKSYTGDKKFFLGDGGLENPSGIKKLNLNNETGLGKTPCMAVEIEVEIDSMSEKEFVLCLGADENIIDIKNVAYKYSKITNCIQELEAVKKRWRDILEKIQVYTEVESINIFLNGWCLYQTIASRLLAKSGYYQSGGAYGFRDQLQDTLALKYVCPEKVKDQIILHSKHQFVEGDVEHWWHKETGRGIRTRFSDDLLWLPFVTTEYIGATSDYGLLDIEVPYLDGVQLEENQDERYDLYTESKVVEPIYNHCIKAIDRSLNFGEKGLPKIGSGDWNDGLSNVGVKGKGESVWLGFFLYLILERFIPICKKKNDEQRAIFYEENMKNLKKALNNVAWDGRWFKRAYADNGDTLGSIENEECRIDSISQSWAVISGAGDNDKKFIAMESLENHLVDTQNGIIKLLDPPFEKGKLEPGYIKAYLPGVRENGGQYTHASCWVIIAESMLGFGEKALDYYRMINPIEHSRTKETAKKYKVEPYVIAADIYGAQNLSGMGGWTWYTGSSSWFYKAGIEYILGFRIEDNKIKFKPCVPKSWREYNIRYKYDRSIYNIKFCNSGENVREIRVKVNGVECQNEIVMDGSGKIYNVEVFF